MLVVVERILYPVEGFGVAVKSDGAAEVAFDMAVVAMSVVKVAGTVPCLTKSRTIGQWFGEKWQSQSPSVWSWRGFPDCR